MYQLEFSNLRSQAADREGISVAVLLKRGREERALRCFWACCRELVSQVR